MRKLSKLYKIALEEYKKEDDVDVDFYLCNHISDFGRTREVITLKEQKVLIEHFAKQRPTPEKHVLFYEHPLCIKDVTREVWFSGDYKSEKGRGVRMEFLYYLIGYCKEEGI